LGTFTGEDNEKVLYRYNRMDAKQLYNYPAEKLKNDTSLLNPGMRDLQEMTGNSLTLLIVTLLLLYLVLGAQFESFSIPLLFLLSLPPAFSGALLFLVISGNTLNINAIIALVVLFGISVNNAILLYEACISKKSEYGRTQFPRETIISACTGKLRAVMVTTVTTVAALIPFAIDPQKMNAQSSLSVAVIGGLIFSFVLVLTVIPLCFNFILSRRKG
jgi:HAE1 family hydrophobic/amphiphilic exporter-1